MKKDEKTRLMIPKRTRRVGIFIGGSVFNLEPMELNAILERCRYYGLVPVIELFQEKGQIPISLVKKEVDAGLVFDDGNRCTVLLSGVDVPLVFVNTNLRNMPGVVTYDEKRGIQLAVEHFVNMGRKHIGYIYTSGELYCLEDRITGLTEGCRQAGLKEPAILEIDRSLWPGVANIQIREIMKNFLNKNSRINAMILQPDLLAPLWYEVVRARGFRIPEDVAVIGYNNTFAAQFVDPQLSSLWPSLYGVGHTVVDYLVRRMNNGDGSAEPYVISYQIIRRGSTHS